LFFFLTFLLVHLSINYADSVKSPTAATDSAASAVASESSPADQNLTVEDVAGLLGVLLGLRNLMPLACDASSFAQDSAFQLKGSFGAKVTEKDTHVDVLLVLRVNTAHLIHFILLSYTFCTISRWTLDSRTCHTDAFIWSLGQK